MLLSELSLGLKVQSEDCNLRNCDPEIHGWFQSKLVAWHTHLMPDVVKIFYSVLNLVAYDVPYVLCCLQKEDLLLLICSFLLGPGYSLPRLQKCTFIFYIHSWIGRGIKGR